MSNFLTRPWKSVHSCIRSLSTLYFVWIGSVVRPVLIFFFFFGVQKAGATKKRPNVPLSAGKTANKILKLVGQLSSIVLYKS
jgi:hypothetical protein